MAHNVALLLAAVACFGGVRLWGAWKAGGFRRPSPALPVVGEADEFPQVIDEPESPVERQGRGAAPKVDTSRTGVKGVWIRPGDDDDD